MLAVVQAYILKDLVFGNTQPRAEGGRHNLLSPSKTQQRASLHRALCEILWQIGASTMCKVALPGKNSLPKPRPYERKYVADGFTETLNIYTVKAFEDLKDLMWTHLHIV